MWCVIILYSPLVNMINNNDGTTVWCVIILYSPLVNMINNNEARQCGVL